jgi:hypothetical protein
MKYHFVRYLQASMVVCATILLSANGFCKETDTLKDADPLASAQAKGFYSVLVLHRNDGQELLESNIREALAGKSDVFVHSVRADSTSIAGTLRQLKLDAETIPTPIALVISSNNLVTGIFTRAPKADRLKEALLPEQPLAVRTALSGDKTVLIKAQSKTTLGNVETDKAISAYLADASITNKVVVLPVDLDKAENVPFLKQLKIDPANEKQSVLICLAPPLKIVNKAFRGAATKDIILKTSSPACATSCAPGSS